MRSQQGYDAKEKGKCKLPFGLIMVEQQIVSWQWVAGGLRDASLLHDPITPLINYPAHDQASSSTPLHPHDIRPLVHDLDETMIHTAHRILPPSPLPRPKN